MKMAVTNCCKLSRYQMVSSGVTESITWKPSLWGGLWVNAGLHYHLPAPHVLHLPSCKVGTPHYYFLPGAPVTRNVSGLPEDFERQYLPVVKVAEGFRSWPPKGGWGSALGLS